LLAGVRRKTDANAFDLRSGEQKRGPKAGRDGERMGSRHRGGLCLTATYCVCQIAEARTLNAPTQGSGLWRGGSADHFAVSLHMVHKCRDAHGTPEAGTGNRFQIKI
jgi:hypothetical protein